jgi:hypothetical protein
MKLFNKNMLALIAAFLIVLIIVLAATFYVWQEMGVVALGFHGWLAVGLGSAGSIILGAGLMWLSFYSSRSGYDEKAGDLSDEDDDDKA